MDRIRINFTTTGNGGPPVLLIHGMGASLYDWEALAPALASAGFRTYAVDLPGHGESGKPDDPMLYSAEAIYSALECWIESLGFQQPVLLVGHSLGGYLSLRYAMRSPNKVRALALVNPFYSPRQLSPAMRWLQRRPFLGEKALRLVPQRILHTMMGWDPTTVANFSPWARQQIAADLKRCSPRIVYIPRTIPDLTPELHQVKNPCLVIWGDHDRTLAPASFPVLVSGLAEASGQRVAGCGHQPHIGRPELVNYLMLDFFSKR